MRALAREGRAPAPKEIYETHPKHSSAKEAMLEQNLLFACDLILRRRTHLAGGAKSEGLEADFAAHEQVTDCPFGRHFGIAERLRGSDGGEPRRALRGHPERRFRHPAKIGRAS